MEGLSSTGLPRLVSKGLHSLMVVMCFGKVISWLVLGSFQDLMLLRFGMIVLLDTCFSLT